MNSTNDIKKLFLKILIASLSLSALIGIIIFLFGKFGDTEGKIVLTTLSFGASSLAGLCCSSIYPNDKLKSFSILGIATSVAFLIFSIIAIWGHINNIVVKYYADTSALTFTFAHISLLLLIKNTSPIVKNVLKATVFFISIVSIMLMTMWHNKIDNEFYYRLLGVFAILDTLGTIILPILNKTIKTD